MGSVFHMIPRVSPCIPGCSPRFQMFSGIITSPLGVPCVFIFSPASPRISDHNRGLLWFPAFPCFQSFTVCSLQFPACPQTNTTCPLSRFHRLPEFMHVFLGSPRFSRTTPICSLCDPIPSSLPEIIHYFSTFRSCFRPRVYPVFLIVYRLSPCVRTVPFVSPNSDLSSVSRCLNFSLCFPEFPTLSKIPRVPLPVPFPGVSRKFRDVL